MYICNAMESIAGQRSVFSLSHFSEFHINKLKNIILKVMFTSLKWKISHPLFSQLNDIYIRDFVNTGHS